MTYLVTAGFVTVETNVGPGRARVDIPRGVVLPADVSMEDVEALLRRGAIVAGSEEGEQASEESPGVPDGTASDVLNWVNADPADIRERARMALDIEQAKGDNARKVLVASLQKLAEA